MLKGEPVTTKETTASWILRVIGAEIDRLHMTERMDVLDLVDFDLDKRKSEASVSLASIVNKIRASAAPDQSQFDTARAIRRKLARDERAEKQMLKDIDAELDAKGMPPE
ncbi:hypothetical protein LGH82_13940 [Mesorhizobium sp. PAMC28654]|uniref:hypothetical protein n=1 Tax=Mesorhizobium sp. PAMC28654 TaxID=2880934 RepID=UPI001D0B2648|nr:hypothetical protein [Mesorhizobium sp. PAMC28654]UDL92226.1 hypothetical protein LGH82_13940 [Mesorhizobium sp. PAMC28654]